MLIKKKSVLLCKSSSDSLQSVDIYEEILGQYGYSSKTIPAIDFILKSEPLQDKKRLPSDYAGVIFTSPRAVTSTKQFFKDDICDWNSLQIFVVGKTTAQLVQKELFLNTTGEESGNANDLADLIIDQYKKLGNDKPFLFPCGNITTDNLLNKLKDANIPLEPVIVYETVPNSNFEDMLRIFTKDGAECAEFVVFFSPSGVKFCLPSFVKLNIQMSNLKLIAIGQTTANSMINHNLIVSSIAKKPTPEALVETIRMLSII